MCRTVTLMIAVVHAACAALTPAFPAVAALRVPRLHVGVTPAVALLRALAIHDGALSVVAAVGFSPLAAAAAAAPPLNGAFEQAAAGTVAGACLLRLEEAAAVSAAGLLASIVRFLEAAAGNPAAAGTPSLRVRLSGCAALRAAARRSAWVQAAVTRGGGPKRRCCRLGERRRSGGPTPERGAGGDGRAVNGGGRRGGAAAPGAEVDNVELDISAQYTRIYPYSCRSCVFLMYSVHAPTIIMCLNNSLRSGYNVIRVEILCLSLSDSRNWLCATTTVWGSPCDAAGEQDANVGYQICDRGWTFATKREMCLAHLSRMPGPRREGVWVSAA